MLQLYREEPNWNFPYRLGGFLIGGLFEVFKCDCDINFIEGGGGGLGNDHLRRFSNPPPSPPQSEISWDRRLKSLGRGSKKFCLDKSI